MRRLALALAVPVAFATACFGSSSAGAPRSQPTHHAAPSRTSGGGAWPQYHRTAHRSGRATTTIATPLHPEWSGDLDGSVYGEALYVNGMVLAATENDSVYALSPADGHQLWRTNLGRPQNQDELPCGDINPLGITGTPAYDAATNSVFVVAETEGGHHTLWALNATDGHRRWHKNMDILPGRDRATEQERSALLVAHGRVYTAYGGLYGDCGNYIGYVTSNSVTGHGKTFHYAVPSAREAGMWSPAGPVLGRNGDIYVAAGNGAELSGRFDKSDSVTELTPNKLRRVAIFAPSAWKSDNRQDLDLGSSSPVVVGKRLVIAGKRGTVYLLPQHLGGIGGQVAKLTGCPAFGGAAVSGHVVVMPCISGVRALVVHGKSMHWRWTDDGVYGSPVIAGKKVFVADRFSSTLRVLSLRTGRQIGTVATRTLPHFPSATIVANHVFVPTLSGVNAFRGS